MARPRTFTDAQILEAARATFLEKGAHVSTTVIAKAIGLSQAALFKRFKTKNNLLIRALIPKMDAPWMRRLEAGPTDQAIDEQLVEIGVEAVHWFRAMVPRVLVLRSAGLQPSLLAQYLDELPPVRVIRLFTQFVQAAVEKGQMADVDPNVFAIQLMGALHGRVFFTHMFNLPPIPADDVAYVTQIVANLWQGTAPSESP